MPVAALLDEGQQCESVEMLGLAALLTIKRGGDEAVFDNVRPLLELMGKDITPVGGHGAGQATKVTNQIIVARP